MALLPIVTNIAIDFNQKKTATRIALVSLDISKAFNEIDHILLLEKVSKTDLDRNISRWIAAYLRGRTAVCLFQGATSKELKCHFGVSLWRVLCCLTFSSRISLVMPNATNPTQMTFPQT
jgi:hypothetical protein